MFRNLLFELCWITDLKLLWSCCVSAHHAIGFCSTLCAADNSDTVNIFWTSLFVPVTDYTIVICRGFPHYWTLLEYVVITVKGRDGEKFMKIILSVLASSGAY